jgi:hypothetical protein
VYSRGAPGAVVDTAVAVTVYSVTGTPPEIVEMVVIILAK